MTSWQPCPAFPVHDVPDGASGDTKGISELRLRNATLSVNVPDLQYLTCSKLCTVTGLPSLNAFWRCSAAMACTRGGSAFLCHVGHIHGHCSKPQMIRVDACGVIATVTDSVPLGDRPAKQDIGEPMRQLAMPRSRRVINYPVSILIPPTGPHPARDGLMDASPESRFKAVIGSVIVAVDVSPQALATIHGHEQVTAATSAFNQLVGWFHCILQRVHGGYIIASAPNGRQEAWIGQQLGRPADTGVHAVAHRLGLPRLGRGYWRKRVCRKLVAETNG